MNVEILAIRHNETGIYYLFDEKPVQTKGQLYLVSIQKIQPPLQLAKISYQMTVVALKEFDYGFGWVHVESATKESLGKLLYKEVYPQLNLKVGDWVWMDLHIIEV